MTTEVQTPIDIIESEHKNTMKFIELLDISMDGAAGIKVSTVYAWYELMTASGCEITATKGSLECQYKKDNCVFKFTLSWKPKITMTLCSKSYKLICEPMSGCDYNFKALIDRFVKVSNIVANNPDISFTMVKFDLSDLKMAIS